MTDYEIEMAFENFIGLRAAWATYCGILSSDDRCIYGWGARFLDFFNGWMDALKQQGGATASTNKLKAEIAVLVNEFESVHQTVYLVPGHRAVIEKLRQLSAV